MTSTPPPPPGLLIDSDARLLRYWRALMGEGGFGRRTIWVMFLDGADRTLPALIPIDDVPPVPDERFVRNLLHIAASLATDQPGLGVAMLLSRPGRVGMTDEDRAWASMLVRFARELAVRMWPVHLATYESVVPFAPDDLIGAFARSA